MPIDPKDIKVGDLVVYDGKAQNWIGWVEEMEQFVGKPLEVISYNMDDGVYCAYEDDLWWYPFDHIDLYNPTPVHTLPQCNCPIFQGCSCGAFVAEMAAKGKVRNPVTKLWEAVL